MKRAGNLYERIADPENLRLAFWKARKGKDGKADVEEYRAHLTAELLRLREELLAQDVPVGDYHYFTVHDPKERRICAANFRERVLHHAIINVCEPVFERYQVHDSYACRKGKGLHAALDRARHFTRGHAWYLKLDVRKYFDSIAHDMLKTHLERRFKDRPLLALFGRIIDSYYTVPGRGIPIGNLTSQYFANNYLAVLDHWAQARPGIGGHVRYMDDLVLWADEKAVLVSAEQELRTLASDSLGLELKPGCLHRTKQGVTMLGYRVLPDRVLLARRSRRRFSGKLKAYWQALERGEWSQAEFGAHVLPLVAFTNPLQRKGFRQRVMSDVGCWPQARTA